jgi:hypothetical protein
MRCMSSQLETFRVSVLARELRYAQDHIGSAGPLFAAEHLKLKDTGTA